MKLLREVETPVCIFRLFVQPSGTEMWYCEFKSVDHPVRKNLFKMSGAQPRD